MNFPRGSQWTAAVAAISIAFTVGAQDNAALEREVERGMEMWHVPGMAVAVVGADSVDFQRGFGSTATEVGSDVDEHTLFAIASTTKAMIAAGILILADDGELSLDDPLIKFVPEVHFGDPALTPQVTLRDLLAHRTGLPSTDAWVFLQHIQLDEAIQRLGKVSSVAAPRSRFIYQNTMYELSGMVIERVSGKSWQDFLTERLWQPIGMQSTYGARGFISPDKSHVLPYQYFNDELVQADWDLDPNHADAAGSVWSSVHDMSLWAQFLLRGGVTADGERLISEESMADMFEPAHLASEGDFYPTTALTKPNWRTYGLGWFQQDFQGRKIDFHTGSLSGLIAMIGLDRANGKAMVVLGNRDHAEMRHAILWYVMDQTPDSEKRDWNQETFDLYEGIAAEAAAQIDEIDAARISGTSPALPLEAYAGNYENNLIGPVTVAVDGDNMTLSTNLHTLEMAHWHVETFEVSKEEWDFRGWVSFDIGTDGKVNSMNAFGEDFSRVPEE